METWREGDAFIDRVCPRYSELKNKDFYFIITAADRNKRAMNRTIEGFRGFTSCLDKAHEKDILLGTGVWEPGEIKGKETMDKAFKMGKNI